MKAKQTLLLIAVITASLVSALQAQTCTGTPPPPTNPGVDVLSPYEIRFHVTQITGSQVGFHAERSSDGITWAVINSGYPSGVFFDADVLLPPAAGMPNEWYYRTRAYDACGNVSLYCAVVETQTYAGTPPNEMLPGNPSSFTAVVNNTNNAIELHWTLGAFVGVSGYQVNPNFSVITPQGQTVQIWRSTDGGTFHAIQGIANISSYTDGGVTHGHTYSYKVKSYNQFGWGGFSGNQTGGTGFTNTSSVMF